MPTLDFSKPHDILVVPASEELRQALAGPSPFGELAPPGSDEEIEIGRRFLAEMTAGQDDVLAEYANEVRIAGPAGEIRALLFNPARRARGAVLHIHGGGWYSGAPEMMATQLAQWANEDDLAVLSVDYRLAPEHPYPAACDDCETAARWWADYCVEHYDTHKVFVAGESAGAHLGAVTMLRMKRRHGFAFSGAVLTYGLYDFTNGLPSRQVVDGRNLVQDSAMCDFYARCFVPDPALRNDPDVSPLYADLDDLPPTLLVVGELDPFYDDSLLLHMRQVAAGNRSYLAVYREAPHGFEMFDPAAAERRRPMVQAFVAACS